MIAYFIRTCYDLRELALLLILTLDNGLDNGRMVRSQIDEDVPHTCLPQGLKESERSRIPEDWSAGYNIITR
jgi:hypothetical protein